MKNSKMTRVKKQQKKDRNNRRFSSVLMCGLVLSGVILPSAVALAETVNNSVTEQVKPATEQAKTPQASTQASTEASKVAPKETTPSSVTPVAPSKATATDAKALQGSVSNGTNPDNKGGVVTFYCIDAKSNKTIGMSVTGGPIGDAFSETAQKIKGYKLDTDKSEETISGTFTKQSQTYYFVYNAETPTPDPDPNAKLRGVLESTIKDAKMYLDKTKYKEAYVNKLDTAIKAGEKALQDNPAISNLSDVDKTFQSNIDSINTAVKDVKANPVDPTPSKQDGVVRIGFYNNDTKTLIGYKEVKGHIGDSYTLDAGLDIYKGNKLIGSLPTDVKFEDPKDLPDTSPNFVLNPEDVTVALMYNQTAESEKVPVKFSFFDLANTSSPIKVLKTVTLNLTLGTEYIIGDHKELFELAGYTLDSSANYVGLGINEFAMTEGYLVPFNKNNTPTPTPDNGGGTDKNGGNGSNGTGDNGSSTDKSTTNKSKDKAKSDAKAKDTLPSTGESTTLVATLSGLGVMLVAGLSLVFKRKRN